MSGKESGAYLRKKKAYWHRVLQEFAVELPVGIQVLDAGCGPAGIFIALDRQRVTAIDPLLADYAALDHFDPSWYPWVQFQACPLEMYAAGEAYSWAFCLNAINHVADLDKALHHLTQAVGEGGELLLTVDVHRSPWLKAIFRAVPGDILHPHQHGRDDYLQRLCKMGWSIRQIKNLKTGKIFNYIGIHAVKTNA